MKSKSRRHPSIIFAKPITVFPSKEVLRQAWGLFVFSSLFAVLFNAFYSDGIELKFKPPKKIHLMDQHHTPLTYSGWPTPTSKKTPKETSTSLPPASDNIPRISLIGAKARFDKKNSLFLDARKPEEYKEGHISGSLNFYGNELDKFAPLVIPQLTDKTGEIIVYCHGGDCDLSLLVAKSLMETGYTHVEIFADGWPAWKKAAYPITSGENP
jgi:rhodanese-related sulfurtransferase